MTIYETLAAFDARIKALESAPAVDGSTFASIDALAAVSADVDAIKAEIGTPPVAEPAA